MTIRKTFLIIEVEPPEALSARKLVIETAKHNVVTAYSGREGLEMFERFPAVDAVVVHSAIRDLPCSKIARAVKRKNPDLPIMVLAPSHNFTCAPADHVVSSHDPHELLEVLESLAA
jgi:DNA-binding response OmpR family regulator